MPAPASLYVRHVTSNVKTGVDVELGPRVLLVGPNAAGKSSVENALTLALAGCAYDVTGRAEVKDARALLALAPGIDVLFARAALSDGRVAEWQTERRPDGSVASPKPVVPVRVAFPVREIREHLCGSSEKARAFLLSRAANGVERDDVIGRLPPAARPLYPTYAKSYAGLDEITVLLRVQQDAEREVREANKEARVIEAAGTRSSQGLAPEPTAAQLMTAAQAERDAEQAWRAAIYADAQRIDGTMVEERRAELLAAVHDFQQADAAAKQAEQAVSPESNDAATQRVRREALAAVVDLHRSFGLTECLVCGSELGSDQVHRMHDFVLELEQASARDEHVERVREQARQLRDATERLRDTALGLARQFEELERRFAAQPAEPQAPVVEAAWKQAQAHHAALRSAAEAWRVVRATHAQAAATSRASEDIQQLADGCTDVVLSLLDSATRSFEARVQAYLPPGDRFALRLRENGKDVCRFGFVREGIGGEPVLHTALSGAEWARLTLALACACAENHAADTLLIFTPEERAFDPVTLRSVMAALAKAPGQVILTSPVRFAGKAPAGWTVVELGEKKERKARKAENGAVEEPEEPELTGSAPEAADDGIPWE